jgi:hypothetical protein
MPPNPAVGGGLREVVEGADQLDHELACRTEVKRGHQFAAGQRRLPGW